MLSMIAAHTGLFFFSQSNILFILGRLAFPLFAWMVANSLFYTKNITLYAKLLLLFAIISQLPFLLANWEINPSYFQLNILFTFLLQNSKQNLIKKYS